jgi:hypothetical protein
VSDKRPVQNRIEHITLTIITEKETGFVSVIATRRKPSEIEKERCDWQNGHLVEGFVFHIIGRGDQLHPSYLSALCEAYADGGGPWHSVDLSALDMKPSSFASFKKRTGKKAQAEADAVYESMTPHDWNNDPVWKRIREINAGVRDDHN